MLRVIGAAFAVKHLNDALLTPRNPNASGSRIEWVDLLVIAAWGSPAARRVAVVPLDGRSRRGVTVGSGACQVWWASVTPDRRSLIELPERRRTRGPPDALREDTGSAIGRARAGPQDRSTGHRGSHQAHRGATCRGGHAATGGAASSASSRRSRCGSGPAPATRRRTSAHSIGSSLSREARTCGAMATVPSGPRSCLRQ